MKLINVPIEPLEERYSIQWDEWFRKEFSSVFPENIVNIYGGRTSGKIKNGSFLDVVETNIYKTQQLEQILQWFRREYDGKEKVVIFFQDLWFPGLETIAYLRNGMGWYNVRICGCLHAGSYDSEDFLHKKGMTPWASLLEKGWFSYIVDKIFFATSFHKRLVIQTRQVPDHKCVVTGFPIYDIPGGEQPKENIVVFPHRLDSEKNPAIFDALEESCKKEGWRFVKSKEACCNKEEYYSLLRRAKIAVSFAKQETWGIAMQEAVFCDCLPLVPNRLSYEEMYEDAFLFDNFPEAVEKCKDMMSWQEILQERLREQKAFLLSCGKEAIPNMCRQIKEL